MKRKLPLTTFPMRTLWPLGLLLILSGCGADQLGSKIDIKSIFNPDEIPPEIAIVSMQSDMERLGDYSITYQLRDDVKGSGIGSSKVYYSPDPNSVDFYPIGSLKEGVHDLKVCAPNSNAHPNPTFRFEASDRNDNKMENYELVLNEEATSLPTLQPMLINEILPEATLTPFPKTTVNTVDVAINACKRKNCSNDALKLEDFQNNIFVKVQLNDATQPGINDAASATETAWVDCDDVLANGLTSPVLPSDGDHVLSVWVKSVDTDYTDVSSTSEDVTINYDTTPPALAGRVVEGPTLIAKSKASYRLNDCSDVSHVFINKGSEPAPSATGWQECSQEFYSMSYTNYIAGDNTLNFWVKDDVDNVNSTPLTYTTNYNAPSFSVVDGPTITKPIADITISFCQEADIEYVLFNSDGTLPDTNDTSWQTCSKAIGHLKSYELAPGPHTMKTFLKYEDGLISPNPLDVDVTYSPTLTWLDAPSVNRPQTTFSVASCEGVDSIWIQKSTDPAPDPTAVSPNWQTCDTNIALDYSALEVGTNNLSGWLKDADDNLYADPVDVTAVFNPPQAAVVDGPDISTSDYRAALTISECDGISEVLVNFDGATEPATADTGWQTCSTAFGAFKTPNPLLTEGAHSIFTWFKYDDGFILPFADQNDITFTPPDTTPPPTNGATPINLTLDNGDAATPPLLLSNSSRAFFTLNTCDSDGAGVAEDIITGVFLSVDSTTKPDSTQSGWLNCSTAASDLATVSMADGVHTVSFFFKDQSGNVTNYDATFDQDVQVDTSTAPLPADVPRPPIEIQNAPTLTTSPAQMRIDPAYDCTGIDQLYFEVDEGVASEPSSSSPIWQNCSDATYEMIYKMILAGEYNLRAWFKSPEGVINPTPRKVSFIFDPSPSSLAAPIAYWSLDQEHIYKQKAVDIISNNHLTISSVDQVSAKSDAAVKQGLELTGTKSYVVGRNQASLKPTVGVTLSLWAYLTNGDAGNKALAGNLSGAAGYGLELQSGNLRFSVNGLTTEVSVATSSITTGWHHIVGTSNGQLTELYIDGEKVADNDTGVAANIVYGCTNLFAIGAKVDCTENVVNGTFFDNALDEVVVWDTKLSSDDVFQHYVDTANEFKVNQNTTASTSVTSASFYKEITDSALYTVPNCSGIQFIYSDTTTHPPTLTSPRWQPCAEFTGAFNREDLAIGPHELKIWTKDGFGNLSSTYHFLDTTIEVDTGAPNPILMYNFDATHLAGNLVYDLFSLQHAVNYGADNLASMENEGFRFKEAESDYVEAKDAAFSQVKDEVSLSVWTDMLAPSGSEVIAGNRTGAGHGYSLEMEGTDLSFILETTAGQRKATITNYVGGSFKNQNNVIATYNGEVVNIYINGALETTADYTGAGVAQITYNCLSSFVVGARATCNTGGVAPFSNNIIDEVTVWNKALNASQSFKFYSGQDNIPPDEGLLSVTPRNNEYTVGIPVAKLNVSDCSDAKSVYVALDDAVPPADASNWQTCTETGDLIETPLLANGENIVKVWFKDAAENVSTGPHTINPNITFDFDFTIPEPGSYWSFNQANVDGSTVYDLINDHHGTSTAVTEVEGASQEALNFNGMTSRISAPYTVDHQPTEAVSLSAWVKIDSFTTGEKTIAGNAYGNGGYALTLDETAQEIVWKVYVNGAFRTIRADVSTWNLGEYHLISGIYGSGVLRLFVDQAEILPSLDLGDTTLPVAYEHANAFKIGAQVDDGVGNVPGTFFTGKIDEVAMWPVALTDTVIDEIYSRAQGDDQVYYNVIPPTMPTTLGIDYYNSLVSRANLTVTDCTDIEYIIVTDSEFPPDKNDEDWQLCNTLVGGTLSKELSTSEEFGKVWTKDVSGNVSKEFKYTPLTTKYDLPIARPVVHWTFDNAHYNSSEKYFFDRISGAKLLNTYTKRTFNMTAEDATHCPLPVGEDPVNWNVIYNIDYSPTDQGTLTNQNAILLEGAKIDNDMQYMRSDDLGKLRPDGSFSISTWVEIEPNEADQKHIISTWENDGYAIRLRNVAGNNRLEFVIKLANGETLVPYLETDEITDDPVTNSSWHLVTGVYDSTTGEASLYFDGIFVKSFKSTTPSAVSYNENVSFMVGADPGVGKYPNSFPQCSKTKDGPGPTLPEFNGGFDNGRIDEILIWNKPLTGLMVSSLYHNGADIIYDGDLTPPAPPEVAQENQRPLMYSDTVYASVLSCNDVSGVLVNEGTQPDKQDARWEVCRVREGSFKYENLTPGGHTVTLWFKDAAGNVTPTSSDVVIDYVSLDTPKANAYWPLDSTHYVDRQQRDIISNSKEHELHANHFNNDLNPTADPFPQGPNALQESVDLSNNAYLTTPSTRLLGPVNELSVGGWFYLDPNDTSTKYLIDHYDDDQGPSGYRLYLQGTELRFNTTLDIHADSTLSYPRSSLLVGWNHIIGVFDGLNTYLYVNGTQVSTAGPLSEPDFIVWASRTPLNIGASSNDATFPSTYFNNKVSDIGVWGMVLDSDEVVSAYNKGVNGELIAAPHPAPNNVSNAYAYYYDTFGPRARITILNCTNTPYIRVTDTNSAPVNTGEDWHDCRTDEGAILSEELTPGTNQVYIWAKNANGDVSSEAAILELDNPVVDDRALPLPYSYFSMNNEHFDVNPLDYLLGQTASISGTVSLTPFLDKQAASIGSSSANYMSVVPYYKNDLRDGITVMLWAELSQAESGTKGLFSTASKISARSDLAMYTRNGRVYFEVYRSRDRDYEINSDYAYASFPTSYLKNGANFLSATYDGRRIQLYHDGILMDEVDIPTEYFQNNTDRRIQLDRLHNFLVGRADVPPTPGSSGSGSATSANTKVDEFMVFDDILTETEVWNHYKRLKDFAPNDTNPLATTPSIAVEEMTNTGASAWTSDRKSPYYTLSTCDGMSSVYISTNPTDPQFDTPGWQSCSTDNGTLTGPDLASGSNTVYFWFRDRYGNISPSESLTVTYNIPPTPDPIAYWPFDVATIFNGRAYEVVAQKHADIYYAESVTGKRNEGLDFDKTSHFVRVPHDASLKTEEFTISGWFNLRSMTSNVLATNSQNSSDGWRLRVYNTSSLTSNTELKTYLQFSVATTAGQRVSTIPFLTLYGTNIMRHLALTYDGRRVRWYVDSTLRHTEDFGSNARAVYDPALQTPLFIGSDYSTKYGASSLLDGIVDEFALFNRALNDDHILDIYNRTHVDNLPLYDTGRTNIASADIAARVTEVYQSTELFMSNRIRLTLSGCTGIDMIHVSDRTTAPPADDPDWQTCNNFHGGILSAPLSNGDTVTPVAYTRTFEGVVSSTSGSTGETVKIGGLDASGNVDSTVSVETIPRSSAHFSLNSFTENYKSGSTNTAVAGENLYDSHNYIPEGPFGSVPLVGQCAVPTFSTTEMIHEGGYVFKRVNSECLTFPAQPANLPEHDITISAWAELSRGETSEQYIVSNRQNGASESGAGAGLRLKNGELQFFVSVRTRDNTTGSIFEEKIGFDTQLYDDGLHFITGTYDGRRLNLYIDGVEVASKRLQIYGPGRYYMVNDTVTPWMIGAEISTNNGPALFTHFDGKIDDIRIWDKVLTESEIFALFTYGSQFIPGNVSDGIPPVRTDVAISEDSTILSKPFANIKMPSCTSQSQPDGASGTVTPNINAVYIMITDAAIDTPAELTNRPTASSGRDLNSDGSPDGTGWLYCTLDPDQLRSLVLKSGPSNVWVFLRDDEGDVGLASDTPIEVEYDPPIMISSKAYYDFETGTSAHYDEVSGIALRGTNGVKTSPAIQSGSHVTCESSTDAYCTISTPDGFKTKTTSIDYEIDKNFAISFWHYPRSMSETTPQYLAHMPNQFYLKRHHSTNEVVFKLNAWGSGPERYSQSSLFLDQWNHILLTRSGTTVSLYLNGSLDTTFEIWDLPLGFSDDWFEFAIAEGHYDELTIFDEGLTEDQALYLFFLGSNDLSVDQRLNQVVPAKIPDHYYTFDSGDVATNKLIETLGSGLDFDIFNSVDTANLTSKVGESFYFTRYVPEAPISNDGNTSGLPEYLEANAPIELGTNFTISVWVNPTKPNSGRPEYYTILNQWGQTEQEQSFFLRMHRRGNSTTSTVDRYQFGFRIGTGPGSFHNIETNDTFSSPGQWHHLIIKKHRDQVAIYVNGIQRGFKNIGTNYKINFDPLVSPNLRIGTSHHATYPEGDPRQRFEGHIDELGIWKNEGFTFRKLRELYLRGTNNVALPYQPEVVLHSETNTTSETEAPLSINDCGGHSFVRVSADGGSTFSSWVSCTTTEGGILTPDLSGTDGPRSIVVQFGSDGVNSNYSYNFDIQYQADNPPPAPAAPVAGLPSLTDPYFSSFIDIDVNNCTDVKAYYIGPTGSAPSPSQPGWNGCSTSIKYKDLVNGTNNFSIWFKDEFGQIATTAQPDNSQSFTVNYQRPALPAPEFYLSFEGLSAGSAAAIELSQNTLYQSSGTNSSILADSLSPKAYRFNSNEYLESLTENISGELALGTNFTIASWVNVSTPNESRSSIINEWSGTAAEDRFSLEIDKEGRLCFAFQTTSSTGDADFNSTKYRRTCSFEKLTFSTWQHIALTRSGLNIDLYINGEVVKGIQLENEALQSFNSTVPTRIGAQGRGSGTYALDGSVDELGVWNQTLTMDEILAHYSLGTEQLALDYPMYQAQAPALPIHYWNHEGPFSGTDPFFLNDQVGALDLEQTNVTFDNTDGLISNFSSFDGTAQYKSNSGALGVTRDFTIATWVKYSSGTGSDTPLVYKWGTTSADQEFKLEVLSDDKVRFTYNTFDGAATATTSLTSNTTLDVDEWSHIAVTRKEDRVLLFINGTIEGMLTGVDTENLNAGTARIMLASQDGSNFLYGDMDETAIWANPMEPWQIHSIYERSAKEVAPDPLPTTMEVSVWNPSNTVPNATTTADLTVSECPYADTVVIIDQNAATPGTWTGAVSCSEEMGGLSTPTLNAGTTEDYYVHFKDNAGVDTQTVGPISITRE